VRVNDGCNRVGRIVKSVDELEAKGHAQSQQKEDSASDGDRLPKKFHPTSADKPRVYATKMSE
jgi:hypothetical protein